jgi:hypothetical protein
MELALQQYYFISATINTTLNGLGDRISAKECPTYLAAVQQFIDDMKAATWPPDVSTQLDELIQSEEYLLFVTDEKCGGDQSVLDAANQRERAAVFAWRQSIGAPTDV